MTIVAAVLAVALIEQTSRLQRCRADLRNAAVLRLADRAHWILRVHGLDVPQDAPAPPDPVEVLLP